MPERAPSDGANMLRLDGLRTLLEEVLAIREASGRQGAHV
jgi:3-deoxy-D-manno-octulosonic acid (KDO) 8-phosphate synthase